MYFSNFSHIFWFFAFRFCFCYETISQHFSASNMMTCSEICGMTNCGKISVFGYVEALDDFHPAVKLPGDGQ